MEKVKNTFRTKRTTFYGSHDMHNISCVMLWSYSCLDDTNEAREFDKQNRLSKKTMGVWKGLGPHVKTSRNAIILRRNTQHTRVFRKCWSWERRGRNSIETNAWILGKVNCPTKKTVEMLKWHGLSLSETKRMRSEEIVTSASKAAAYGFSLPIIPSVKF